MPAPTERNRLADSASPYLQAHADNPVNWQPWDERALAAARERDVPIFLSIGYSACHWCHVMAEESFEDERVAEQLNESFVPIKVDREERPDVDNIYMTVCQLVRGGGCGWPLSVWLTPEGNPFYVGTYFPKESRRGQPGFRSLLDRLSTKWEEDRESLEERGAEWMDAVKNNLEATPEPAVDPPGSESLERAANGLVDAADREHGGFGKGQKFPQPSRLEVLALASDRTTVGGTNEVLDETLAAMISGGLRDHLGGGFHRYCVDREWVVPHFEKMLYDNATVPHALLSGYQQTGDDRYADVAAETFQFVERELTHPEGGFYSTLDARSPPVDGEEETERGVEGAYYVWTPEQVAEAMQAKEAEQHDLDPSFLTDLATSRYGITDAGNFEGKTVLTLARSVPELADVFDRPVDEIRVALAEADERLLATRNDRPRPPRDEKVLAGWNGLMIDALAEGSLSLGDPRYATLAKEALTFVRSKHWDGSTLSRRYMERDAQGEETVQEDGEAAAPGVLEDYAFLARGALTVYETTGEVEPLSFALELTRAIEREFWDADRQTLFYTPISGEKLPVRPQEVADGSTPSSTGVAVEMLLAMDAVAPMEGFGDIAGAVLRTHGKSISDRAMGHPTLVRAAEIHANGTLEIVIAGSESPEDWLADIGGRYIPDRLLAHRPPEESGLAEWVDILGLSEVPPLWAEREARDGPTAYVCRQACSPPVQTRDELREWLDEFSL